MKNYAIYIAVAISFLSSALLLCFAIIKCFQPDGETASMVYGMGASALSLVGIAVLLLKTKNKL